MGVLGQWLLLPLTAALRACYSCLPQDGGRVVVDALSTLVFLVLTARAAGPLAKLRVRLCQTTAPYLLSQYHIDKYLFYALLLRQKRMARKSAHRELARAGRFV